MTTMLTLLLDVAPNAATLPVNGMKVAGWAGALSTFVFVIGWVLKQPAFGSWLDNLSPKQKRIAMLAIAGFVAAVGTLTNDHMNSTEAWTVAIGTFLGPTFMQEHGVKGLARASEPTTPTITSNDVTPPPATPS